MAASSTVFRFAIALSDIDRGVYEELDLQLAQHPSETGAYLVTRALAFALQWREDLVVGPGLCVGEEPAMSVPDPTGRTLLWVDVGAPSTERLDKASRHSDAVAVVTHRDVERLTEQWRAGTIRRAERVTVIGLPAVVVDAVEARLDRRNAWDVLRTEGRLYVTVAGETFEGPLELRTLA